MKKTSLPEEAFVAMYQLAEEKYSYLDRMQEWETRKGLARLFSKPRDPFPDVQEYQLADYLQDALKGSFPELSGYRGDRARPDQYRCEPMVFVRKGGPLELTFDVHMKDAHSFHRECYVYKPGYGFVDSGYSENGTSLQVASNRNTVVSRRMEGREACGEPMAYVFQRLDYFRKNVGKRLDVVGGISHMYLRDLFRMLTEYRRDMAENARERSLQKPPVADEVTTLRDYVDKKRRMVRTAYSVSRDMTENTEQVRDEFNLFEKRCKAYCENKSAYGTYEYGDAIAREKLKGTEFDMDTAVRFWDRLQTYPNVVLDTKAESWKWCAEKFATVARDYGMSASDICMFLKNYAGLDGMDVENHVLDCIRSVDRDSLHRLDSAVRDSFYQNDMRVLTRSYAPDPKNVTFLQNTLGIGSSVTVKKEDEGVKVQTKAAIRPLKTKGKGVTL